MPMKYWIVVAVLSGCGSTSAKDCPSSEVSPHQTQNANSSTRGNGTSPGNGGENLAIGAALVELLRIREEYGQGVDGIIRAGLQHQCRGVALAKEFNLEEMSIEQLLPMDLLSQAEYVHCGTMTLKNGTPVPGPFLNTINAKYHKDNPSGYPVRE